MVTSAWKKSYTYLYSLTNIYTHQLIEIDIGL